MYLARSSSILWQTLTKPLNYSVKDQNEQRFLYERLELLDQQYCLRVDQQLWQSYFDIGLQKHVWPVGLVFKVIPILTLLFTSRLNSILWQKPMTSNCPNDIS